MLDTVVQAAAPRAERLPLRDMEVVGRIAAGDTDALATLYDDHCRLVFSIALRITADWSGAEEVTQDVFQIVWTHAATFRPTAGTVAEWLIGITRHCAIDRIRGRQAERRRGELWLDESLEGMLQAGPAFEEKVTLRGTVRAALATLPAEQRRVLELAYYGGLSATEIAAVLAIPVGTVKTRLRLGLVKLRTALAPG